VGPLGTPSPIDLSYLPWVIPVIGRGGPYVCETLRLPYFLDNRLTKGGEFNLMGEMSHLDPNYQQ
jgi:hypothetical protein